MSSFQSSGRAFGQAKVSDLALVLELHHGLDCLLDWSVAVHSLLKIQIDVVRIQAFETTFASLLDVLGLTADQHPGFGFLNLNSKFGGKEDFTSTSCLLEPSANKSFVVEWAIGITSNPTCLH